MQPFERHPADLGELETCGEQLLTQAADAIENGDMTRQAYQPAIDNWDGMGAPELAAARDPVQNDCQDTSHALAWAAVVCQYWSGQVRSFNDVVDSIDKGPHYGATGEDGGPPTDEAVAEARSAARRQWWEAYNTYILDGGDRVEAMLRDGPTQEHVAEARRLGVLPGPSLNPLPGIWGGIEGQLIPPDGDGYGGWFDQALWGVGRGQFLLGATSSLMDLRYRNYVRGHWRGTPSGGRTYVNPYWRMRPGMGSDAAARAAQARWASASRWASRGGGVLAFGTAAWNQWQRDTGRTDLDTGERVARTTTRGAMVGAGAAAGAKGGAVVGAAIGTAIAPGVGTAIGGVVGGVIGGVAGAGVADKAADFAVEGVSKAWDGVKGLFG